MLLTERLAIMCTDRKTDNAVYNRETDVYTQRQYCVQPESRLCFVQTDICTDRKTYNLCFVQTERQTIYVLCRQADRQCCVQIDGHVQTTLYTDRDTDTALI